MCTAFVRKGKDIITGFNFDMNIGGMDYCPVIEKDRVFLGMRLSPEILEMMPAQNYRIQYMKFSEEHLNEVMCDVIIAEAQGNIPEIKTKMTFMPIRYLGYWVLTVPNFETGRRTIVKGDERDSIRQAYENLEYEKKVAKGEAE